MTASGTVAVPSLPGPADAGPGTGGITGGPALTLTWAELHQEISQAERTGLCRHPVRLKGRIDAIDLATGELRPVYDTATEPGGALLTACGNRRETVCPPCSAVYKRDARQLVRAGLTGGKGIPETVAAHPCVFATFTAPSFGPVHARRMRGHTVLPCRPRRDARTRALPARPRHLLPRPPPSRGPAAGTAAVRPTATTTPPRCCSTPARPTCGAGSSPTCPAASPPWPGCPSGGCGRWCGSATSRSPSTRPAAWSTSTPSSAWTALRCPAATTPTAHRPRPSPRTCCATRSARPPQRSAITADPGGGQLPVRLGFGTQTDARPIRHDPALPGTGGKLSVQAVANYIAKYATKALDAPGIPARPLRTLADLHAVRCSRHYQRMITCAWQLGGSPDSGHRPGSGSGPTCSATAATS